MFSRMLSAAMLLIVCFVLAACGGGDSTDTDSAEATTASSAEAEAGEDSASEEDGDGAAPSVSGPSLKKAKYIKEGDAICGKVPQAFQPLSEEVNAELQEEETKQKKKFSTAEQEEQVMLKAVIPPLETAIDEFGKLGSPEGDEKFAQEVVDAFQAAKNGLEEDPSLPLTGKGSPFEEFVALTQGYGFEACPQL